MKKLLPFLIFSFILYGFMGTVVQQDRWLAPKEAQTIKNPVPLSERYASSVKGKKIFKTRCMICHGPKGKGDGPGGKALDPKPQNLTSELVQDQKDGELFWKVSNGRNAMIKWGPILSAQERWDAINYVRTLK